MKFDLKELKRLITLVEEANISELSLEDKEGEKVSIKKGGSISFANSTSHPIQMQNFSSPTPTENSQANLTTNPDSENANTEKSAPQDSELVSIKSPIVGTYYASANPDAPAYIKEGDHIKIGDTVCIVEAMKLFNEIESEVSGIVSKILVKNASTVEYGQPLILVKQD